MRSTTGHILAFLTLPRVLPRVRLLCKGNGYFAAAVASSTAALGLLPSAHPYTQPHSRGRFSVVNVLLECARHTDFSRKNADKVILLVAVFVLLALVAAQIAVLGVSLSFSLANASGMQGPMLNWFHTIAPEKDMAFMVLDRVFGIPGMFNSCVALQTPCFTNEALSEQWPGQTSVAFREMLGFYNKGIFAIASMLTLYHVVKIASDTARTGKPFGGHFENAFVPLRLICVLGLLVPMGAELNAGQWIVMYAAKWGSGFASQGWDKYASALNLSNDYTLLGPAEYVLALPKAPQVNNIVQFMSVAKTCQKSYAAMYPGREIKAYIISDNIHAQPRHMELIEAMQLKLHQLQVWNSNSSLKVVFGHYSTEYGSSLANIKPYCGEVIMEIDRMQKPSGSAAYVDAQDYLAFMSVYQFVSVPWYWNSSLPPVMIGSGGNPAFDHIAEAVSNRNLPIKIYGDRPRPTFQQKQAAFSWYDAVADGQVQEAYILMQDPTAFETAFGDLQGGVDWRTGAVQHGWAGAALWYNRVAAVNGGFAAAAGRLPAVSKWPMVMEYARSEREKTNTFLSLMDTYEPHLGNGTAIHFENYRDNALIQPLNYTYSMWQDYYEESKPPLTSSVFEDAVNAIMGRTGLWSLRDNQNMHPVVALGSLGKTLIDASVTALATGGVAGAASIVGGKSIISDIGGVLVGLLLAVFWTCFACGALLYYVIPFLPFLYMFFALVAWVKAIFTAVVAAPMWVLAHLRTDGNGFVTKQSMHGYHLILEILLRPILIVIGLIGALIISEALVKTLNVVFDTVTSGLAGDALTIRVPDGVSGFKRVDISSGPTGTDQIFYLVLYTYAVFTIVMASFKMVDQVPSHILRWIGSHDEVMGQDTDVGSELQQKARSASNKAQDTIQTATAKMGF